MGNETGPALVMASGGMGGQPPGGGDWFKRDKGHYAPVSEPPRPLPPQMAKLMAPNRPSSIHESHAREREARQGMDYTERDVALHRYLPLPDMEAAMAKRGASNEMGAAYHPGNLKYPVSLAVQREGSDSRSVNMEDLRPRGGRARSMSASGASGPSRGNGLSDLVVTHNHPGGNPLSDGDIQQAMLHNFGQVRAVGPQGTFALSRPEQGWGNIDRTNRGAALMSISGQITGARATAEQTLQTAQRNDGAALLRSDRGGDERFHDYHLLRQHETGAELARRISAPYAFPQALVQSQHNSVNTDFPVMQQQQRRAAAQNPLNLPEIPQRRQANTGSSGTQTNTNPTGGGRPPRRGSFG